MNTLKKTIGVYPPDEVRVRRLTFASLEELFPVVFEPFYPEESAIPDACVFLGQYHPVANKLGIPCYVRENRPVGLVAAQTKIKFSTESNLHRAIRGQTLVEYGPRELSFCTPTDGDSAVASLDDCAIWTVRGLVHRVTIDLPCLVDNDDLLYGHCQPKCWLGLLPFLHFLRSLTAEGDWQAPALRACFIIDDPNLHAQTYGGVDFRRLAYDARERNYHVAIATVPLDAWYVNQNAARLFSEYSDCLSLAVHGSDHTRCELTDTYESQFRRLSQALQRIDALERKTGLDVSRVMVAPHEACSEITMDLMLKLGYEGLVIKPSKLRYWTPKKDWGRDFGFRNVEWTSAGFPIVLRFLLQESVTQARLAAFLGQPIVPYGHPSDISLELLRNFAEAINSSDVRWTDLKSIMRSNYRTRTIGDLLQIQLGSRHVRLKVPEQTRQISVERPWMLETEAETLVVVRGAGEGSIEPSAGRITGPFDVIPGSEITIRTLPKEQVNYRTLPKPRSSAWSMVRRVLVEARDRLKPVVVAAGR